MLLTWTGFIAKQIFSGVMPPLCIEFTKFWMSVVLLATNKRVFTLRLSDEVFDKIGVLATKEHRSITNYIEYVLLKHLEEVEREQGEIDLDDPKGD